MAEMTAIPGLASIFLNPKLQELLFRYPGISRRMLTLDSSLKISTDAPV